MTTNSTAIDPLQLERIRFKTRLMRWRMQRTKAFAAATGRSLEEAMLYINQRCGASVLSVAVDELVNEMDSLVPAEWHSSNEPFFLHP